MPPTQQNRGRGPTVTQLRVEARRLGIPGASKLRKAGLQAAIAKAKRQNARIRPTPTTPTTIRTQTVPALRQRWFHRTRELLQDFREDCSLDGIITVGREIGHGIAAQVYEGTFVADPSLDSVAVRIGFQSIPKRVIDAFQITNRMVLDEVCPNFTLVCGGCSTNHKGVQIMEQADGTASQLLNSDLFAPSMVSMVMQMLMAIVAMSYGEMAHNDLHLKNILYNRIEPDAWFSCSALGTVYSFPSTGFLFKTVDYDLLSSPVIGAPHRTQLNMGTLYIQYPMARDLWQLKADVEHFLGVLKRPSPEREWLKVFSTEVGLRVLQPENYGWVYGEAYLATGEQLRQAIFAILGTLNKVDPFGADVGERTIRSNVDGAKLLFI
jgi:hypothetical protein